MPNQYAVIGLDIGGTHSKMAFVDATGKILASTRFPSFGQVSFDKFVQRLLEEVSLLKKQFKQPLHFLGMGVGAPDADSKNGTMEHPSNFNWGSSVPVAATLEQHLHFPVFLINDANASALGEMAFGTAKGKKDFFVVTLGTGLGSGIVVDGNILNGSRGFAGELGHVTIRENGRSCACGKKGCLETYASVTGLKRTVFKLLGNEYIESRLRHLSFTKMDGELIAEAAQKGDLLAQKAFEETGKVLGMGLANAAVLFDPELIILAGGLANAGDLLLKPTVKSMEEHLFGVYKNQLKVVISEMESANAAVLGAAALALKMGQ